MKKLYSIIAFAIAFLALNPLKAQITPPYPGNINVTSPYFEGFEANPPAFSTTNVQQGTNPWVRTNTLAIEGQWSMRCGPTTINQNPTLTTNPFSTVGQGKVWLYFAHIAKVPVGYEALVEVSVNNGPFTALTSANSTYLGTSATFTTNNNFNEISYPDWGGANDVPAQSTWWKRELFDISQIANNQANVRVRFRKSAVGTSFSRDGWYIDSLTIFTAISELDPPVITHTPLAGNINPAAPQNPFSEVVATITDETGVLKAMINYRVNKIGVPPAPFDSIPMTRVSGTSQNGSWRGRLEPPVIDELDTIEYYISATDATPLNNFAKNPTTAPTAFYTYRPGGPPSITHTAITGLQFSAGPFTIRARILDYSNIDSAILHFKTNNNPNWQRRLMVDSVPGQGFFRFVLTAPDVIDGDSVSYFITATDASRRKLFSRFPAGANDSLVFIASGPPTITIVPINVLGQQFTLGPFPIRARITDASGIKEARVNYTVNGGALQSVLMTREAATDTFRGIIPALSDMDSVCYYVSAKDNSIRENEGRFPASNCDRSFRVRAGKVLPFLDEFSVSDPNYTTSTLPIGGAGWERGSINKSVINAPNSPPSAWVTSLTNDYPNNATWILNTPIFNFLNTTGASLSFFQWRDMPAGSGPGAVGVTDAFYMEYTLNEGQTWLRLGSNTTLLSTNWYNRASFSSTGLNDPQGGWDGPTNGWERSEIDLSFLNGVANVQFRFVFRSNNSGTGNGVAVDDFRIGLPLNTDAGVIGIPVPISNEFIQGDVISSEINIRNFGSTPINGLQIGYRIDNNPPVTINYTTTIPPNTSVDSIVLPNFQSPAYDYRVCYFVNLAGDQLRSNDTICRDYYGIPRVTVPFSEHFDGTLQTFRPRVLTGATNDFALGTPNKASVNAAFSPPNAWVTNLTGPVASNMHAALFSPIYNFDGVFNARLTFQQNRQFAANLGGFRISYRIGTGAWTVLDNPATWAKENWYNGTVAFPGGASAGFVTASNGYQNSSILLPSLFNNVQGNVQFRVETFTGNNHVGDGLAIDNFNVVLSPAQEVGLLSIVQPAAAPTPLFYNSTVEITVVNFGNNTLTSIPFNYSLNGVQVLPTDFVWTGSLAPGASTNITLPQFNPPQNANLTLKVYTTLGDAIPMNDTLTRTLRSVYEYDATLVRLVSPVPQTCAVSGSGIPVRLSIQNNGSRDLTNLPITYILNNNQPINEIFAGNIPAFTTQTINFNTPLNVPIGVNQIITSFTLAGDPDSTDNRRVNDIIGTKSSPLNYQNTFDAVNSIDDFCIETGLEGIVFRNTNSRNASAAALELGTNSAGSVWDTASISTIWQPNRNANFFAKAVYQINTLDEDNVHIRFDLLQLSSSANQRNCYFRVVANGQQVGQTFQANNIQTYRSIEFDLTPFYNVGEPILIELQSKVEFRSDPGFQNRNGNFIDSLVIYNKFSNNVGVSAVVFDPPLLTPGVQTNVKGTFDNAGVTSLLSFNADLLLNGVLLQSKLFNLNPALAFSRSIVLQFDSSIVPVVGNNNICIITSLPNGVQDQFTRNDTLCQSFVPFPVIDTWPYCNDFEGTGFNWESTNFSSFSPIQTTWQLGTPQQQIINSARSGNNAWMTGLDRNYASNDSSALYTPSFQVAADSCYKLNFYHKYLIPDLNDGGTVEYTMDGGRTWSQLGWEFEPNWFNQPFIVALRFWERNLKGAGWTGSSNNTWEFAENIFVPRTSGTVIFRFRFASQAGGSSPIIPDESEGWAIDDFCFTLNSGARCIVNVPVIDEAAFVVGQNYPNPFNGNTAFNFNLPLPGKVSVLIRDMMGRVVHSNDLGVKDAGSHSYEFSLQQLNSGVYFYTLQFEDRQITKKMILSK